MVELEAAFNLPAKMTYEWTSEQGFNCTDCQKAVIQPVESAVYTVVATSEQGCTAVDQI